MRRREFIAWLGAVAAAGAWPLPAPAQPAKIARVGFVGFGGPDPNVGLAGLRRGFADRGYLPGRNLQLEERYAEGDPARIPSLVAELLALGVDVLVTGGTPMTLEAHKATITVPIVCVTADPVGVGPRSQSRPAGRQRDGPLLVVDPIQRQVARALEVRSPQPPPSRGSLEP